MWVRVIAKKPLLSKKKNFFLVLNFEANGIASLDCTIFQILAHCGWCRSIGWAICRWSRSGKWSDIRTSIGTPIKTTKGVAWTISVSHTWTPTCTFGTSSTFTCWTTSYNRTFWISPTGFQRLKIIAIGKGYNTKAKNYHFQYIYCHRCRDFYFYKERKIGER